MRWLRRSWLRLAGTFGSSRREPELAEEMEAHLQMLAEEYVRAGMPPEEARRAAVLKFGGVEPAKEAYRDQRGFPSISDLWQDFRLALRMLCRTPAVSLPAIAVLALGIGAAAALYSTVYAMWLRPLPYADPGRLVSVTTYFAGYKLDALSSADYGTWQGTRTLGPLGACSIATAAVAAPGETIEAGHARISGNLLGILGVVPALGRGIQPVDDRPEAPRAAVLSDSFWRERFGADGGVIGRSARINGKAYTIVGVLPRGFRMPNERRADVLTPLALEPDRLAHGRGGAMSILYGVARLRPGVTLLEARAELSTRLAASRAQDPQLYRDDVSIRVIPLHDYVVRDVRTAAIVLSGAVAAVLLIATANVGSLLLARAAERQREMAVRLALGASRSRIVRHLLVEGLSLGAAGVGCGIAAAHAILALIPRLHPALLARIENPAMDRTVLATVLGAGMFCSLAFSLAPALRLPRLRLRRCVVAAELALSLPLAFAAAALLDNLAHLNAVTPGFDPQRLITASVTVKGTRFAEGGEELRRAVRERLLRAPGISAVGFADALPPTAAARITPFTTAGRPLPEPFHRGDDVIVRRVTAGFFPAMGIPLLRGRVLTEADENGNGHVAVVNRTLANRYFAPESPFLTNRWMALGFPGRP